LICELWLQRRKWKNHSAISVQVVVALNEIEHLLRFAAYLSNTAYLKALNITQLKKKY